MPIRRRAAYTGTTIAIVVALLIIRPGLLVGVAVLIALSAIWTIAELRA
jgi:hypothetical protein